ncbi:MAG TPA: hypothetical protein VFQ70_02790 [Candidatus Saccharimonadaceae bacterium]|nr:hypothetical protein [Candidatus Saccharimonadaceae bacterium]
MDQQPPTQQPDMQQLTQPTQPPVAIPDDAQVARVAHTNKLKLIWGLICLIAPTVLIVIAIVAYAITNFVAGSATTPTPAEGDLFAQPSTGQAAGNVILYIAGAISVLTWLPGIVVGIVLLATRKRV